LSCTGCTGWFGVGWTPSSSGQMIVTGSTSDMIAGYIDSTGTTLHAYGFTDRVYPGGYSSILSVAGVSGTQVNGVNTIFFTRFVNAGYQPINSNSSSYVIGSYSSTGDTNPIAYHGPPPYHTTTQISINFYTGASTTKAAGLTIRDAHAIIMFISWGLLLPVGLLVARYFRSFKDALWFKIHRTLQYSGFLIAVAGIIIGYAMTASAPFTYVAHGAIGTVIFILMILQVIVAFFRPHKEPNEKITDERFYFEIFHHWNGRFLVAIAVLQIFLGISAIGYYVTNPWLAPLYGVVVGLTLLFVLGMEIANCIKPFGKIVPCGVHCQTDDSCAYLEKS